MNCFYAFECYWMIHNLLKFDIFVKWQEPNEQPLDITLMRSAVFACCTCILCVDVFFCTSNDYKYVYSNKLLLYTYVVSQLNANIINMLHCLCAAYLKWQSETMTLVKYLCNMASCVDSCNCMWSCPCHVTFEITHWFPDHGFSSML